MDVLFQDDEVVVVAKPPGLATHRGGWADDDDAALQRARDAVGRRLWPVHRLDRGASGALLFATGPEAARRLHEAFEAGAVDKRYLALVRGAPAPGEIVVDHPIPRREDGPRVPATTVVRGLAVAEVADGPGGRRQAYALVEARPRTGRLHQVRRHLKHLGHPLVGDVNYGRSEHNRFFRERFGFARLALHAAGLSWRDARGALVEVRAPVPEDLAAVCAALGIEADVAAGRYGLYSSTVVAGDAAPKP